MCADTTPLKLDEDAEARSARAARAASLLASKYEQLGASVASRTERKIRARANTYSVVAPAIPTSKNSAGVYQDGTDFSYFVQAQFGSTGKAMYMLLDSGAGTSWVMGPDCESDACKMHNTFGAKDSTTFELAGKDFSIQYGSGKVAGQVARDTIQLAGLEDTLSFGVATETSKDFTHFPFDGILGLAINKGSTDNFMAVMSADKKLDSNLFAVSLSRHTEVTNAGSITFGAIDSTKYLGDITYTAVGADKKGYWAIPMDDMGYDGSQAGVHGRFAYIDTGTSFAFGPESDVAALHKLIPGATTKDNVTYSVPCDANKDMTITFSGVSYTIPPRDWVSGRVNCTSNFYGHEVMKDSWLLGDVYLKNVYSVFDADNTRIGFAKKPVAIEVAKTTSLASAATVTSVVTTVVDGATITILPSSPSPVPPAVGLSGSDSAGATAVPEGSGGTSASSTSSSSSSSSGGEMERGGFVSMLVVVGVVVMMA